MHSKTSHPMKELRNWFQYTFAIQSNIRGLQKCQVFYRRDTTVKMNLWYFDWNTASNKMTEMDTYTQNKQLIPNRLI